MIRSLATLALLLFVSTGATPVSGEGDSVYTGFDRDRCATLSEGVEGEPDDHLTLLCPGYQGYPVIYKEGDERQSAYFGHLSPAILEGGNETFGAFNHVGKTVEWRVDRSGKPYAAILRFYVDNMNEATGMPDDAHRGEVLVVSKVGQPGDLKGCVIGYVDALANPDANRIARALADGKARTFRCGWQKPDFHGRKGPKSNEAYYIFPPADSI